MSGLAYVAHRALLPVDGKPKWHVVSRQYSCGFPLYFAHRIIISERAHVADQLLRPVLQENAQTDQ